PAAKMDLGLAVLRKDSIQVFGDAAAGDMCKALNKAFRERFTNHRLIVDVRFQQFIAHGPFKPLNTRTRRQLRRLEENLSCQRISVRVESDRRERDEQITVPD